MHDITLSFFILVGREGESVAKILSDPLTRPVDQPTAIDQIKRSAGGIGK